MDLYCPKCAEPVDNDEFHERADEIDSTYSKVAADFRANGCSALGGKCNPDTINSPKAQVANVIYDLLGDDMDGAASELDDAEFLGLF